MRKKLLLASAMGLCLIGSAAVAQTTPPPPPPAAGAPAAPAPAPDARAPKDESRMAMPDDDDPFGNAALDDDDDAGPGRDGPRGRDHERDGRRGDERKGPRHGRMMPPPPPPPSKAAEFRLHNGPFELRVRCAEDEPMQVCADVALKMLEQAKTLPAPPPPPAR